MVDLPAHGSADATLVALRNASGPRTCTTGTVRRLTVAVALAGVDLAVGLFVIGTYQFVLHGYRLSTPESADASPAFAALPFLLPLIHMILGLYGGRQSSPVERLRLRVLGGGAFALAIAASLLHTQTFALAAMVSAALASAAIAIGYVAEAVIRDLLIRADLWCAPTVIVGCGPAASRLAATLQSQPELGFRPIGFISDGSKDHGTPRDLPLPLLGNLQDGISSDTPIEAALIVLDGGLTEHAGRFNALPFPYLVSVQGSEAVQNLWLHARPLGTAVGVEMRRELMIPSNLLLKRVLDLAIALPLAILALPIVILVGLTILIVDPGPIIYAQGRIGRNGRLVRVFKLRTMYSDAEARLQRLLQNDPVAAAEWERHLKLSEDPRVLPVVGRLIRRTSLDELPQLWNIIRGDMSLVGPRPFPPYHVQRFDQGFQALRASVVPGLTGFWQISSRSDGDLSRQKAEDSFYITNWSVWLDLFILVRTIPAVIQGKGAR